MASSDERTLFISNLNKDVSEDILYELFFQAGPVERVSIPKSNNYNKFGFVTYKHDCSISYALDIFKGTSLFGKELNIKRRGERNSPTNERNQNCPRENIEREPNFPQGRAAEGISSLLPPELNTLLNYGASPDQNKVLTNSSLRGNWTSRNRPSPYNRDRKDNNRNKDRRDDRERRPYRRGRRERY